MNNNNMLVRFCDLVLMKMKTLLLEDKEHKTLCETKQYQQTPHIY